MKEHNLEKLFSEYQDSLDVISDNFLKIREMMEEYLTTYFTPLIPGIMIEDYPDSEKGVEFILVPGRNLVYRKYKAIIKISYSGAIELLYTMPDEHTGKLVTFKSNCKDVYFSPDSPTTKEQKKAFQRQLQKIESFFRGVLEE